MKFSCATRASLKSFIPWILRFPSSLFCRLRNPGLRVTLNVEHFNCCKVQTHFEDVLELTLHARCTTRTLPMFCIWEKTLRHFSVQITFVSQNVNCGPTLLSLLSLHIPHSARASCIHFFHLHNNALHPKFWSKMESWKPSLHYHCSISTQMGKVQWKHPGLTMLQFLLLHILFTGTLLYCSFIPMYTISRHWNNSYALLLRTECSYYESRNMTVVDVHSLCHPNTQKKKWSLWSRTDLQTQRKIQTVHCYRADEHLSTSIP